MQFTKPMIELVYEIRRRVDTDLKPAVKLANPDMLQELAQFYNTCKDVVTKALIKELFYLAGDGVAELGGMGGMSEKPAVQVYRGQISVSPVAAVASKQEAEARQQNTAALSPTAEVQPAKSQRIYRGQIIDS